MAKEKTEKLITLFYHIRNSSYNIVDIIVCIIEIIKYPESLNLNYYPSDASYWQLWRENGLTE